MINREIVGYDQAISLQKRAIALQESLSARPTTIGGRLRFEIAQRVPFLKGVFEVSPMEEVRAELRETLLGLTVNLPILAESGARRIDAYKELKGFYDEATQNPGDWDLTTRLNDRLQEEALQDRQLQVDPQTQVLIDKVLGADDPLKRGEEQQEIFVSASKRLALAEPIVNLDMASIRANSKLRERYLREYSAVLDVSPDLDKLHRNAGALTRGVLVEGRSTEVILQILERTSNAIALAITATEIGNQFEQTRDLPRLVEIAAKAKSLLGNIEDEGLKRS